MDLAFTEEQDLLRGTIREVLQKYSSPEIVRELEDTDPGYRLDLWEELGRQKLLVLARDGLFSVNPAHTERTQLKVMGSDAEFLVRFDGAAAEPVADDAWARFDDAMIDVLIAVAAFAVGGAERAHEMAVEYAK